jgi:hypothetical protein
MVADLVNYLRIYNKRVKSDQVRNEEADLVALVEHIKRRLLLKGNFPHQELDHQRIFARILDQSLTERIENLDGTADNLKDLIL